MEQNNISLIIDNHKVVVPEGTTILDAAKTIGINIPTLCHMHLKGTCADNHPASCRVCVVEVKGRRNLAPSCSTKCTEGMEVKTSSIRVIRARKTVIELMLSDHPNECLSCPKSGKCELQAVTQHLSINETPFAGELSMRKKEMTASIVRNMDKCIYCRRCETMCNVYQSVGALGAVGRGFNTTIAPSFNRMLKDTDCTYCGQCVAVCPVGALTERTYTDQLIDDLENPEKTVIVQVAPAVRVALGEEFGNKPGTIVTGKMVAALKDIGFDYVFDTDFSADATIMEEGSELLERLGRVLEGDKSVPIPLMTSCCPAWVNFYEHNFPDLLQYPSTARSPQQMFGAIAKNYWAEKMNISRDKLVVVSVMPCLAKKFECQRPEFSTNKNPDVDYSITTRELATLIRRANINFDALPHMSFDNPLGESTGAAAIFGSTGGVLEAALRTAYELHTHKPLPKIDFKEVRGIDSVRTATIDFDGFALNVAIAYGLGNARKLMEEIRAGKCKYHVIEIMACPGGCIGGGGQPLHHGDFEIIKARQEAIYEEDRNMPIRKSHENPSIIKMYEEYFGKPLSEKAHALLHTHYSDKTIKY